MKPNRFTAAALAAMMLACNTSLAFPVDFAPGTPLVDALRALGYKSGRNVVINGALNGTVSMHMDDTNFDTALRALAIAHNFSFEYLDNMDTVLIAPQKTMAGIETFKLKHIDPKIAAEQIGVLDNTKVVVNEEANTLTVSGSTASLDKVRSELRNIDVAQQQVNILATVIELSNGKDRNMGLAYSSDPWTKDTSVGGYNGFKFGVAASHEETLSKGKVLARPNVTVFDGRKASILMGDKVPVFTSTSDSNDTDSDTSLSVEYKEVGVKLEVLPRINELDKETITMVIKPSVSTISQWVESGNNKAPQISERSAETTVRVKNGETILLGGLLKNEEIKSIKQIPFLSKIPVLGEIFKSRSIEKKDTEIVIAITPTIVYDEDGRPRVETQTSTKSLHDKLSELRAERSGYAANPRTDEAAKAELDKAKAEAEAANVARKSAEKEKADLKADKENLENNLKNKESTLKQREAELKAKNAEKHGLESNLKDKEEALKQREAELKAKEAENVKLRKELKKSTAMMRAVLDNMDGGDK